jgi:SAM-dependent methyltransferase
MATETIQPGSPTGVPSEGDVRAHLHGMWASVAGAWGAQAGYADERGAALTEELLDRAAIRSGDRVLELACGPGGAGLSAAARVAPDGEVVLSDVAEQMTAIAADRAAARGITNVRTLVLDLEEIDQPDASYDVVLCREGLMFALDPARAAGEIRRVLRTDGRVSIAVWGPRARNPWLGVVFDAVSAQIGQPVPPPGIPGPFSLGDGERVAQLLRTAGFTDVTVTEHDTPLRAGSFDEWWGRTSSLAGPLATILAALPDDALRTLRTRLSSAVQEYTTADGLELPGLSIVASARLRG